MFVTILSAIVFNLKQCHCVREPDTFYVLPLICLSSVIHSSLYSLFYETKIFQLLFVCLFFNFIQEEHFALSLNFLKNLLRWKCSPQISISTFLLWEKQKDQSVQQCINTYMHIYVCMNTYENISVFRFSIYSVLCYITLYHLQNICLLQFGLQLLCISNFAQFFWTAITQWYVANISENDSTNAVFAL